MDWTMYRSRECDGTRTCYLSHTVERSATDIETEQRYFMNSQMGTCTHGTINLVPYTYTCLVECCGMLCMRDWINPTTCLCRSRACCTIGMCTSYYPLNGTVTTYSLAQNS